jgi:signal transduction histidine kinase
VSRLPIRVRLTLAFAGVMAIVLALVGVFVYIRVGDALLTSVDQALRAQATEAVGHAHEGRSLVDNDAAGGTTLAELLDHSGAVVRSNPPGLPPLARPPATAGRGKFGNVSLHAPNGDWRYLSVLAPGGETVVVARSLEPREEALSRLLRELLLAGPLVLLVASLAGYGIASGALRPVEAMRRRAAAVTTPEPGRLPVPAGRDELSRLAETLNEMLDRLGAAFEHERRFVADASHELRTPLALLRAELELALRRRRSASELEAALRSAAAETERLSRLTEELLLIARSDQGPLPLAVEPCAAAELLETVAARFEVRAAAQGRELRVVESDAVVEVDALRIEQALSNLVDNALTYGAGTVELFAVERDDALELHVCDAGSGFPDDFIARAFDRFSRADEGRGSSGGSGLGLSIVALIAKAHGGEAGVENAPAGGADAWVAVPYAGAAAPIETLI